MDFPLPSPFLYLVYSALNQGCNWLGKNQVDNLFPTRRGLLANKTHRLSFRLRFSVVNVRNFVKLSARADATKPRFAQKA